MAVMAHAILRASSSGRSGGGAGKGRSPVPPPERPGELARGLGPRMKLILTERSTFTDNTSLGPGSVLGGKGKDRVKQQDIISLIPF